jgi:hypothetical protein
LNSSIEAVNGQADAIMRFNRRHFVSVRNPHLGDEQFGIEVLVLDSSATLAWIHGDETAQEALCATSKTRRGSGFVQSARESVLQGFDIRGVTFSP